MRMWTLTLALALLSLITGPASAAETAPANLLKQAGVMGGFVVHLGCGDGQFTAGLRTNDTLTVHGLTDDATAVGEIRQRWAADQCSGPLAVDLVPTDHLPYVDNLVNLLVVSDPLGIADNELLRVIVPNGVLARQTAAGEWNLTRKPRDPRLDDWTHYYHDASGNAVAHDDVVGPPRHLQWVGSPRWSRHHDRMASMSALVSCSGRMFYIMDEGSRISIQMPPRWRLIARDAFNGSILWKRDISDWQHHLWPLKSGPTQLTRRLVADENTVFVTLGFNSPVTALNAQTGETVRTYEGTAGAEEMLYRDGLLYVVANPGASELTTYAPLLNTGDQKRVSTEFLWNQQPRVVMVFDATSGKRLWARQTTITPLTASAGLGRLFFHDGDRVLAVDDRTGDVAWQSQPVERRAAVTFNFGPRLVIHDDVVLFAGGNGEMVSLDAASGKQLWDASHPKSGYQSPQDLMVLQGLVWCAGTTSGKDDGVFEGRDPRTGEVKQKFAPNVDTYWFHHRCYIAKATDNYIMPSRTGIEFVDPRQQDWDIHHWVRGGCLYGVMPCNGLTYAPPHDCACYPEAKLFGFNALAAAAPTRPMPEEVSEAGRLELGPAASRSFSRLEDDPEDWPTYRRDAARSGAIPSAVATPMQPQWSTQLRGELTPPVIANGRVFVGEKDTHTLQCLNAKDGRRLWSLTIGGPIDSPPTIWSGRVYLGGSDGWVYCLDANDGALVWRYRAAPEDRRTMAYERLESLWPVQGTVLLLNGEVWAIAGRSIFLDGGLRLLRLKAETGEKIAEKLLNDKNPATGNNIQELLKTLQMPVGLPDIMSTDGKFVFMKSQKFDLEGNRIDIGPVSGDFVEQGSAQQGEGQHLFAPMGYRDESWFHRSYWVFGKNFAGGHGGYYQAGKFTPSGRLLVNGNGYVFGYGRKPQYYKWTTTMEHQLFAATPETSPSEQQKAKGGRRAAPQHEDVSIAPSASLDPSQTPFTIEAWVNPNRPSGAMVVRGGQVSGFGLFLASGKPEFIVRAGEDLTRITGSKRIVGEWHHVAGVLNKDRTMQLYVDGELAAQGQAPTLLTRDPRVGFKVGNDAGSRVGDAADENSYQGLIDDIVFTRQALSAADVAIRARHELPAKFDPALMIDFDQNDARDRTPNQNHGTIAVAVPVEGKFGQALSFTGKTGGATNRTAASSQVDPKWAHDVSIYARGMALADDTLFLVGPRDTIDEEATFERLTRRDESVLAELAQQDRILDGREGSLLLAVDAETGELKLELPLPASPTWDGLAAAHGKLFVSTQDGAVHCLGASE